MAKRGVYHRTINANVEQGGSLKELFPNGNEKYLFLSVKLYDEVLSRIVLCNDELCEDAILWREIQDIIAPTELSISFSTVDKHAFALCQAVDRAENKGFFTCANVHSRNETLAAIGYTLQLYLRACKELDADGTTDKLNIQPPPTMLCYVDEDGNTIQELCTTAQPLDEYAMNMYQ